MRYLKKLLIEAGVDPAIAGGRACVLNWAYLGRSLLPQSVEREEMQTIVEDLLRLMRLRSRKQS